MSVSFPHRQSAHCESGVTANLLTWHGLPLTEAMAFGIGGGLVFGYFPFIKVNHLPLTTFRIRPGAIFRRVTRRLGVSIRRRTFRDERRGTEELDRLLAGGIPVGAQTSVYWLPYFPPALRFHFNAHNLIVYGREGDSYRISDPVLGMPVVCPAAELTRARFAKGPLAPRGRLFHVVGMPEKVDLPKAILKGIRDVCRAMLSVPIPLIGVRGIRSLAAQVESWPSRLGERQAILYLGNVIRMQEEIGTGGGGFRFIYAAFLLETASVLGDGRYGELSRRMTAIGDRWRDFAVAGARHCKGRPEGDGGLGDAARILRECADLEEALFRDLHRLAAGGRGMGRSRG